MAALALTMTAVALALTVAFYKVALGLRQKMMFAPSLLIFYSATMAVPRGEK